MESSTRANTSPPFGVLVVFGAPNLFGMERAVIETFDAVRPEVEPHFLISRANLRRTLPQLDELRRRGLRYSFFSDYWDWKHVTKPKSILHVLEMLTALALSNIDALRELQGNDAIYIPTPHQLYMSVLAAAWCRLTGRPVIFEFHNVYLQPSPSLRILQHLISTFVDGSRFSVDCTTRYLDFIPSHKRTFIQRTVERSEMPTGNSPLAAFEGRRNIIFLGQVASAKGPDMLIRALSFLAPERSDVTLHIVGSGGHELERDMRALVELDGLSDRVHFWGFHSDARSFLSGAYVVAQPSRPSLVLESFGRVVVEAMAFGVPAVIFRNGGLMDSVVHEQTGLICQEETDQCLSAALARLLDDRSLRDGYGAAARDRYNTVFAPEAIRERWLELLIPR